MAFTDLIGRNQALREEVGPMIKIIDDLQADKKAIFDNFSAKNYMPMPGLILLRKHLSCIQEGKTDDAINSNEFIIIQNELQSIKEFANSTMLFGVITNDKSQQNLSDAYRGLAVKYAAMVDSLVKSSTLFYSHQPSNLRGLV